MNQHPRKPTAPRRDRQARGRLVATLRRNLAGATEPALRARLAAAIAALEQRPVQP